MASNRMRPDTEPVPAPLPPNVMVYVPAGFAVCPQQLAAQSAWQQTIYRLAHEQALAATQLPRHHRVLFSVWN